MINRAHETILKYGLLKKGDRVIVGVSGGPDSMALLYALLFLQDRYRLYIHVAHLNHKIRKADAKRDADFVRDTAKKLRLPVTIKDADVPALARRKKLSLEHAAREARYEFYRSLAKKLKAGKVALGHTQDDQAETVLMRLIKGAGLLGLGGIAPIRGFDGIAIIRPLLDISKSDIKKFLRKRKIAFRIDRTNKDTIYFGNKIRLRVLPLLERDFNPAMKKSLAQAASNLRVDYNFIYKEAKKKFARYAGISKGKVELRLGFLREDPALRRMLVRMAIERVKGDLNRITYRHWEDIAELLAGENKEWMLDLPGGLAVMLKGRYMIVEKKHAASRDTKKALPVALKVPGAIRLPRIGMTVRAVECAPVANPKAKKSGTVEYFDREALRFPLRIRFRRPKDRMVPLGMTKGKRLKQLFIDEKVPKAKRALIPLVISGSAIIWVCGIKRSNIARITEATRRTLKLEYRST
ncbi:MAG: tRNA lysidine(34) synthetase TilS [Candidatus Omnitrophota bacterium]